MLLFDAPRIRAHAHGNAVRLHAVGDARDLHFPADIARIDAQFIRAVLHGKHRKFR